MFYNSIVRRVDQSETLVRQFKERTRLSARNSFRKDKRRYSRPVRYLRCWDKKGQLQTAPIDWNQVNVVLYAINAICPARSPCPGLFSSPNI